MSSVALKATFSAALLLASSCTATIAKPANIEILAGKSWEVESRSWDDGRTEFKVFPMGNEEQSEAVRVIYRQPTPPDKERGLIGIIAGAVGYFLRTFIQ